MHYRYGTSLLFASALALAGCEGKLDATGQGPMDRVDGQGPGHTPTPGRDMARSGSDMAHVINDMGMIIAPDGGVITPTDMGVVEPDAGMTGPVLPADPGLRRLTDTQYRNTVRSTLGQLDEGIDDIDWPTSVVMRTLNSSPELDSRVNGVPPFGVYTRVAIAAANHLVGRRSFYGPILDVPEAERIGALSTWLTDNGHLFFRRPLTSDEISYYTTEIVQGPLDHKGLREVVISLFLSPHFLFRVEHGVEQPSDMQKVELTPWEVASRLSYFLWRDAPDTELYAAARDGSLMQESVLRDQVQRLLSDPRSDDFLEMFAIQWLGIKLDRLDYNSIVQFERFQITFHGGESGWDYARYTQFFGATQDRVSLRDAMIEDMTAYMRHVIVNEQGSLRDLFTTTVATSRDVRVSDFYGVAPWDGTSAPPTHDAERGGILGRVLFLGDAAENTHPILRGLHIREHVLCRKMAPPPMDFIFRAPPSPPFSTRQMVDFTTGPDNIGCWGCHQMTNGLGFALDGYDVFGRSRQTEYYFRSRQEREDIARADDTIARWEDVPMGAEVPVNAVALPRLDLSDEVTTTRTPAELAQLIIDWTPQPATETNGEPILDAYQCFARHLSDVGYDGAIVQDSDREAIVSAVRSGSVTEAITTLVLSPSFAQRDFGNELEEDSP